MDESNVDISYDRISREASIRYITPETLAYLTLTLRDSLAGSPRSATEGRRQELRALQLCGLITKLHASAYGLRWDEDAIGLTANVRQALGDLISRLADATKAEGKAELAASFYEQARRLYAAARAGNSLPLREFDYAVPVV